MTRAHYAHCLVGIVLVLCLAACGGRPAKGPPVAASRAAPGSGVGLYKLGSPYQVGGIWYYPVNDLDYDETGIASWYGPDFQERYTANGEVFDQNQVSGAHKTLPMPSIVQVTNLENGRSIQVRVNDRGPFIGNRIIDLSRRAAQLLGYEQAGLAKVRVRILGPESIQSQSLAKLNGTEGGPPPEAAPPAVPRETIVAQALPPPTSPGIRPAPQLSAAQLPSVQAVAPAAPPLRIVRPPAVVAERKPVPAGPALSTVVLVFPVHPTHIFVQVGSYATDSGAQRIKAKFAGVGSTSVSAVRINGANFYRVRLGPIATSDQADAVLSRVVEAGANEAKIIVD